jgi:phosphopantothenoylcysteine decarboxylase/phosphopantothenate--cysteine ligase
MGSKFVEPEEGLVACGDQGKGRLADINLIFEAAVNVVEGK